MTSEHATVCMARVDQ